MKRFLFHTLGCAVLALGFFSALPAQAQTNVGTYTDLQTACAAGGAGNVTLTADILDGTTQLTIERNLTLDLNGHSLTIDLDALTGRVSNSIWLDANVTLTIMDSSPGANALTVINRAGSGSGTAGNGAAINTSGGTLVIESGMVQVEGGDRGAGIGGGHSEAGGIITINGGTVNATGGSNAAGIGGGGVSGNGGTITINDGTVNATGGGYGGAGIGGGSSGDGGIITIAGGTVIASNGGGNAAGIGGGYGGNGGTILITGGTVTADSLGTYGAGIGGGDQGDSGNITISGDAIVTATGGRGTGIGGGGAGIGSGGTHNNNTKTVTGVGTIIINTTGAVNATGGAASTYSVSGILGGAGAAIGQGGYTDNYGAGISNVTHPVAASVIAPATAAFNVTVAAVGATPPTLAYQWQVSTGGAFSNVSNGVGATTASYTTAATTTAMNGYQYRNVITASNVNGDATGSITYTSHPAMLAANAVITSAAISVTAPVVDATPNTTVATCGTDFTCSTVTWTPNDNPFAGSTQYTASITLTANTGYTFTGLAATAATINGNSATVANNTGNTVTLSYQFAATAAITSINTASIAVTEPVTGATPSATVTSCGNGTDFTCGAVTWTPNDNPFAGSTQYTATVTLAASAGYTFTGLTNAIVNGNNATFANNTGSTVTLSYQFAATAATAINTASIDVTAPATGAAPNATVTSCGTDFVCSAVTWAPADNPFQAGTQYTATITLTANAGYTFTGLTTAIINGNNATFANNAGSTVTLSYQFMATSPLATRLTTSIPVLSPVGLVLLALALGGLAFRQRRRSA
jgi:hypothetical protein